MVSRPAPAKRVPIHHGSQPVPWSSLPGQSATANPRSIAAATPAVNHRTAADGWPTVLVHAAHLKDMRAEDLKPGQQPLQRRKIGKLAVQHGLNRRHGNGEVSKVKQRLGRENPGNADLIMR